MRQRKNCGSGRKGSWTTWAIVPLEQVWSDLDGMTSLDPSLGTDLVHSKGRANISTPEFSRVSSLGFHGQD